VSGPTLMKSFQRLDVCRGIGRTIVLAALFMCGPSFANTVPSFQRAAITVSGSGVHSGAKVTLSTGAQQSLVAQADRDGHFVFSNLLYYSFSPLKFTLDIPANTKALASNLPSNHLSLIYDPRGSKARISGTIGKSGTIAFNMQGGQDSLSQIAGDQGYVDLQSSTLQSVASGRTQLVASIINVGEVCCPQLLVPAPPITLTISSMPVPEMPQVTRPVKVAPTIPYVRQNPQPSQAIPNVVTPPANGTKESVPNGAPQKKQIPYLVTGEVHFQDATRLAPDFAAAVSFSSSDYEDTYVGGLEKMADDIRNAILLDIATVGAMLDGRDFNDATRALAVSNAQTMRDYTPSDSVCRFGTLSRSLAISEDVADKNKLGFSKIIADRTNQAKGSMSESPSATAINTLNDFKGKYCDAMVNNGFLKGYCSVAGGTSDLLANRDVDFTRVFDVPLTLDTDFTGSGTGADKESLISLFQNLSLAPPYTNVGGDTFDPGNNTIMTQDMRSINAARQVAENSFGALVSEKVKTTSQSADYMKAVLTQLGVSADDAKKLVGDNPSYFAQMEIMTKKLFQDPAFYANLYDSPTNVDRQKVAMKAVELQQDRDFLESLRRREMLLSVLLNMKLKTDAGRSNQSGHLSGD
jgi:hypothetical protein